MKKKGISRKTRYQVTNCIQTEARLSVANKVGTL